MWPSEERTSCKNTDTQLILQNSGTREWKYTPFQTQNR